MFYQPEIAEQKSNVIVAQTMVDIKNFRVLVICVLTCKAVGKTKTEGNCVLQMKIRNMHESQYCRCIEKR